MCMSISAPGRNMESEARETLETQIKLAPDQYKAEAEYAPKYADLQAKIFKDQLPGMLGTYRDVIAPGMAAADRAATASQRGGDVSDLEKYGTRAVAAVRGANPGQARLMDRLNADAMSELEMGARLDPGMAREVRESVRSGQAARGFGVGQNDVGEEALFTGLQAEKLRQNRRAFASSVVGLNQATSPDAAQLVLARPSGANPALLNAGMMGTKGAAPGLFDPFSAYGQDYGNTNYNAKVGAKINSNNANASLWAAGISAAGQAAGSM